MSGNRSIRKSVPYPSSPSSDSLFYNYSPKMSLSAFKPAVRSPLAEETEMRSPDFVWEAEYQDKMPVLENSISQVPSSEKRQISFQFIDDMKATFDLKSLHSKKKRPTLKQINADNKSAARKDRKSTVKLPEAPKKRRPRNAFILYRTVLQGKAEFKGKTQTELSRLIAACWQREPPETRAHFERAAELEKGNTNPIRPFEPMLNYDVAFGYGATDVFNIKVGPAEKEWDTEGIADHADISSEIDDVSTPFGSNDQSDYSHTINYPMYMPPYSPPFEQPQQDPYQIHASFHMLGSPYTHTPIYAGTPCGQINLSPQQAVFPFNTFPMNTNHDANTSISSEDYGRSPSTFYATPMEQSARSVPNTESYTLPTTPPEVSDIPVDYSAFESYNVNYNQNMAQQESHQVDTGYSREVTNQETYQEYDSSNHHGIFNPQYPATSHHAIENAQTSNNGMFMQPQYPVNSQPALDGEISFAFGQG